MRRRPAGWASFSAVVLAAALALLAAGGATAAPKEDPREQTARQFYASGKYREAIEVFAQLYAGKPHPNYLFNIGRCYQNLPDPDHAIISFKDYLRKSPKISADEKKEIEGYIQEMVELRKNRDSAESTLGEIGTEPAKPAVAVVAPKEVPAAKAEPAAAKPVEPPAKPIEIAAAPKDPPAAPKEAAADPKAADAKAADHLADPGAAQLALWHSKGEALWKEQAARADDAKLAQIEGMLGKAPASDPRRADYALFLGKLYGAKHFKARLQASESRKLDDAADGTKPASSADRKALDAEANAAFLKAVSSYLEAAKAKAFGRADEALYQLAMILDANNMDARARTILARLVGSMPNSKFGRQVAGGGAP